tara:strand:- start:1031 stop:1852 length:822 start_codon:yes stop_codon:yes gene_type:complete
MNKVSTFLILIPLLYLFSCKTAEKAKKSDLEGKKTEYLVNQMNLNAFEFSTLNFKASVQIENEGGKKNSFRANFRLKKDSAIWISISPALGIEVARLLITDDTVKIINRLNKEYFIGDYNYLNKRFNIELEFQLLQALILGNPIDFEINEKLNFSTDKTFYYLGNLKKRKAKKADDKPQKIERKDEEVFSIWLEPINFKISKLLFSDLSANRFVQGKYSNFTSINDQSLAQNLDFNFQSEKPVKIKMDYSKIDLNESINFPFNVPSKYEQVFY